VFITVVVYVVYVSLLEKKPTDDDLWLLADSAVCQFLVTQITRPRVSYDAAF
jgi:hypothetical protein